MQTKHLAGIVDAALLLAGCSPSNELTPADQNVRFVWEKPGAEHQLLGTTTDKQSGWLPGQNGDEDGSVRGVVNTLRNQAVAIGKNMIYGVSSPTQNLLSSLVPTDNEMSGQVYKCPNWYVTPLSASAERGVVAR